MKSLHDTFRNETPGLSNRTSSFQWSPLGLSAPTKHHLPAGLFQATHLRLLNQRYTTPCDPRSSSLYTARTLPWGHTAIPTHTLIRALTNLKEWTGLGCSGAWRWLISGQAKAPPEALGKAPMPGLLARRSIRVQHNTSYTLTRNKRRTVLGLRDGLSSWRSRHDVSGGFSHGWASAYTKHLARMTHMVG